LAGVLFFALFFFFFFGRGGGKSLLNYYCNYRWVSPGNCLCNFAAPCCSRLLCAAPWVFSGILGCLRPRFPSSSSTGSLLWHRWWLCWSDDYDFITFSCSCALCA